MKIIIDAGHGGHDNGASGKYSKEKDNVLKVGLRLKQLLEQAGHTVKMTRSTDVYLTLNQRSAISNQWKADFFISLHNNAATNLSASGFETFIFNGRVSSTSIKAQQAIHKAVSNELKIRDRGMKRANFAVLRNTNCASILMEYAFISNSDDEQVLINKIEQMAVSTAQGIINYFGGKPIPSNQVASTHKPSTPKKEEDEEMKFSSPSLKEETELTLSSKARRDLIVDFAVKNGAHESWLEKHKNNKMTEHDYLALSAMTVVNLTK